MCRQALNTSQFPEPTTSYLIYLIELILTCNNFSFNRDHYLQTQGTAMGSRMAPSYTNLFMANLEEDLKQPISNPPLVTYRRPKNLRGLLVHSTLTTPAPSTNTGNNKCNNRRCKCCQEMVTSNTFESQITGRMYHI